MAVRAGSRSAIICSVRTNAPAVSAWPPTTPGAQLQERQVMSEQGVGAAGRAKFDPSRYLRQGRGRDGNDYLGVKWRLVWLRSEHPDAQISTEHVTITS